MKRILFVLFCLCVSLGFTAVSRERPNENAKPGTCLSITRPELGPMNYGESKQVPNKCIKLFCTHDGSIIGHTCGSLGVGPGQYLTEYDYSKPYPDCCPKLEQRD